MREKAVSSTHAAKITESQRVRLFSQVVTAMPQESGPAVVVWPLGKE